MRFAYIHYLDESDTALEHVRQVTNAIRAQGHTVDELAVNIAPETLDTDMPGRRPGHTKWSIQPTIARYMRAPRLFLENLPHLVREIQFLRRVAPDVLLARVSLMTGSYVVATRLLRVPLVIEVNAPIEEVRRFHDEYSYPPGIPEAFESWQCHRANRVIVVSSPLRRYLLDRYGLEPGSVTSVPNGADLELFQTSNRDLSTPGTDHPNSVVIGFVGSFQSFHGLDLLTRMTSRVAALRSQTRFLFVGDGPGLAKLQDSLESIASRVRYTGRVNHTQIPQLTKSLQIGVLPNTAFYMSPLKVLEWMAAGRAIVAPRRESVQEIIDDGVDGLLFTPGDENDFVEQVVRLVDSPELRHRLGAAAAEKAARHFTWDETATKVIAACAEAVRNFRQS